MQDCWDVATVGKEKTFIERGALQISSYGARNGALRHTIEYNRVEYMTRRYHNKQCREMSEERRRNIGKCSCGFDAREAWTSSQSEDGQFDVWMVRLLGQRLGCLDLLPLLHSHPPA